tara:strand:+ start:65 stop:1018 length:954 start_codon:yes stop_codon:yes gene_type:complete
MFNSKNKGFSLVELIVVLIITAILAQLGFTAFNRYARRTRAFAAKTALKNIQRECESNRDLEAPETFTLLPIKGYSIATKDTNSCYGQSSDGKVAVIADNQNQIPNYFYDFLSGDIICSVNNESSSIFKNCKVLSELEKIQNSNRKNADEMIAKYNISNGNCPICHNGSTMGDPLLDPEDELYYKPGYVPVYDPDMFQRNLHMMKAAGLTCESKFIGSNWRTNNTSWNDASKGNYEKLASGYVLIKGSSKEQFRLNAKKIGLRPVNLDTEGEREFLQNHYGRSPEHDNNQDCQIAEVKFNSWDFSNSGSRYWEENKP